MQQIGRIYGEDNGHTDTRKRVWVRDNSRKTRMRALVQPRLLSSKKRWGHKIKIEILKTCTDGHAMSALWSRANWQPHSRGSRALLGYWKHCSRTQQPPPPHCITISDNVVITFRRFRSLVSCVLHYSWYFFFFLRDHIRSADY